MATAVGPSVTGMSCLFSLGQQGCCFCVGQSGCKGRADEPSTLHPVFYAAYYKFYFSAEHVPGVLNVVADALSQNNVPSFPILFHRCLSRASQHQY